jgi:hypothetical protein
LLAFLQCAGEWSHLNRESHFLDYGIRQDVIKQTLQNSKREMSLEEQEILQNKENHQAQRKSVVIHCAPASVRP